ncbi:MAG: terminase TerL endonuclease subunit [Ruminococcus sp.]|nr:terminase TerL endonuclease subunit [Ruminococcus sp.]
MTTPTTSKAYIYCKANVRLKTTPKYVKKTMREFMRLCEGKDPKYKVSTKRIRQIEEITKLLIMPKGLKAGKTIYEVSEGYQWITYCASLAVVYRNNEDRRRYETILLELCRKNYKTFTVATVFILAFVMEPKFSQFYSVAPDGSLSREIREAISLILKSSPLIYEYKGVKRFKILRDYITFLPLESKYTPLNYSNSNLDGKLPNLFCADEVGALPNSYAIEAMRSGQLNILNKLGFIISTKYPTLNNPFEDEVSYAKKVLDGIIPDETYFSLLYEPDDIKNWQKNDLILKQSNPVALTNPAIWEDLLKKRAKAIAQESARENFVTKHCNIIYSGAGTETYIDVSKVQECKVTEINWSGKVVYLGLDLSESGDNTSVSMLAVDDDNRILAESFAFIPEGRIEEKTSTERVNYRELIKTGKVIPCGDLVIDYGVVESFVLSLEERFGVTIQAVAFDRWNCLAVAQHLEAQGLNTIEVRQHSSILHAPTKLLKEKILNGEFMYTENPLYEINFLNARCTYDTNRNLYVSKKKSSGKVDMVVSTIDAMYLVQQDYLFSDGGFTVQVI